MARMVSGVGAAAICLATLAASTGLTGQNSEVSVHADLQAYMAAQTAAFQNVTSFSFGVYSDIHMVENASWGLTRAQWQSELTQWRDAGNLFGVIVGDLGYGNVTDPANVLSGPASVIGAPSIFYAMGNHETDGIGKRAWIDALYPGAVQTGNWTAVSGLAGGNADRAYWSFNVGPSTHFIFLDGDYMTVSLGTSYVRETLGQAQLTWLAADIRANADKNLLVFIHEPIDQQLYGTTPDYTLNDRAGLLDLLAAHPKQKFVFSGHFHGLPGITRWRGVTSVHVMTSAAPAYGASPYYGVRVTVNDNQITISGPGTGVVTDFDQFAENKVQTIGGQQVVAVAEEGTNCGNTRGKQMVPVSAENGVSPTAGTLMLKAQNMSWYDPRFISDQLLKIQPGMKFSFDMYLADVVNGLDAVTVQPAWYMKDGSVPPLVVDQNGIQLSRKPKDGMYFLYNDDVPFLGGRATGKWYHREFDLSALAGNYVDGVYLTSGATRVNVGTIYVDNIGFTWPSSSPVPAVNVPPTVSLTAPSDGASLLSPATMTVSATAGDTDGTVARVDFYANSTLIGSRTASPYSIGWTVNAAGVYALTAVATDNAGASTISTAARITVNAPATSGSSAAFVRTDTTTQGTWRGVYGSQGYVLANDAAAVPAYAKVAAAAPTWTWASSTTDPRGLQRPNDTSRLAACWCSSMFTTDVNITDGAAHQIAVYALDWDSRSRTERVDVVDAVSGTVLDTRALTGFGGGQYFVWTVSGHVAIRVTVTGGPNAVTSGLFFDPAGGSSTGSTSPVNSAVFVRTDATTQGTWRGVYGNAGYALANDATSYPGFAQVSITAPAWTWASSTSDVRALQRVGTTSRIAAGWYGSVFTFSVTLTDGKAHQIAAYMLDWDYRSRTERIDIVDAVTGAVLDSRSIGTFDAGRYVVWTISGKVTIRVTNTGGANAVVSGLFFD